MCFFTTNYGNIFMEKRYRSVPEACRLCDLSRFHYAIGKTNWNMRDDYEAEFPGPFWSHSQRIPIIRAALLIEELVHFYLGFRMSSESTSNEDWLSVSVLRQQQPNPVNMLLTFLTFRFLWVDSVFFFFHRSFLLYLLLSCLILRD